MYFAALVAIGWLYVTVLMAATQPSVVAGLATFLFYGLLPVAIIVYVMLAPERRKRRRAREAAEEHARLAGPRGDAASGSPIKPD